MSVTRLKQWTKPIEGRPGADDAPVAPVSPAAASADETAADKKPGKKPGRGK